MQSVNYIKHLKNAWVLFSKDSRLNPTHISLYMALFQIWNINRFPEEFFINREEVMRFSKIGSKSTYHKCVKELSYWKYIIYYPSHNPFKGSKIKMFKFETSTEQVANSSSPINRQVLVSINKHIQTNKNKIKPLSLKEVLIFFKKKNWSKKEAQKFFNYYESVGWKKGNHLIKNWHAAAESWVLKIDDFKRRKLKEELINKELPLNQNQDNLHISQNKKYDEPL